MRKINLFDKSEEIFDKLPKRYAEIILNSIIAKSLENGKLLEEAKNFMNTDDLSELFNSMNIEIKFEKKNNIKKEKIDNEKIRKVEEKILNKDNMKKDFSVFEGFD